MNENYVLSELDLEEAYEVEDRSQDYLDFEYHALGKEETFRDIYENFYDATQSVSDFLNVVEEWG